LMCVRHRVLCRRGLNFGWLNWRGCVCSDARDEHRCADGHRAGCAQIPAHFAERRAVLSGEAFAFHFESFRGLAIGKTVCCGASATFCEPLPRVLKAL
jgi:hypothetical protein